MDHPAQDKPKPVETLRDGRLKATIWENVNDKNEPYHSVKLAKLYEDREGKLQDTTSFSQGDLLRVAELAREAHGVIRGLRREQAAEQKAERSADRGADRGDQKTSRAAHSRAARQPQSRGMSYER